MNRHAESFDYLGRRWFVGQLVARTSGAYAFDLGRISAICVRDGLIPSFTVTFEACKTPVAGFAWYELTPAEETGYGWNYAGRPHYWNAGWIRKDLYISKATGEKFLERRRAAGKDDCSAMARGDYGGIKGNIRYSADCPCCYLNFSHTVDHHNSVVEMHHARAAVAGAGGMAAENE